MIEGGKTFADAVAVHVEIKGSLTIGKLKRAGCAAGLTIITSARTRLSSKKLVLRTCPRKESKSNSASGNPAQSEDLLAENDPVPVRKIKRNGFTTSTPSRTTRASPVSLATSLAGDQLN